tara:strand:- start:447 stop:695 length:249 start_codon:yes stop_codon:yes gene_type:complete
VVSGKQTPLWIEQPTLALMIRMPRRVMLKNRMVKCRQFEGDALIVYVGNQEPHKTPKKPREKNVTGLPSIESIGKKNRPADF